MVDAYREANLLKPDFNQNAVFVWVTFKRTSVQPHKLPPLLFEKEDITNEATAH